MFRAVLAKTVSRIDGTESDPHGTLRSPPCAVRWGHMESALSHPVVSLPRKWTNLAPLLRRTPSQPCPEDSVGRPPAVAHKSGSSVGE